MPSLPWLPWTLVCVSTAILGQDPVDIADPVAIHPSAIQPGGAQSERRIFTRPVGGIGPALPVWRYEMKSPVNGVTYSGYMVGSNPMIRERRTTTIPVVLIPFIVQFTNTASGFTTTFDPSSAADAGCTAGQTVMSLVENSPLFQNYPWTLNGVNVGTTQYIDAFQRANFWKMMEPIDPDYHTLLSYTVAAPLTLALNYASPTLAAEVRVGAASPCTNAVGSGSTNAAGYQGIADYNVLENAMRGYISQHQITPDQLAIFILYNVMYSQNGGIFLGGFHFTEAVFPQSLIAPGQTFILANFRTNGTGPLDVSILSHEIGEWMDDPGGSNPVPPWGNIGEVIGCKRALEVGDPLTQIDLPPITASNGFTYHIQELAYFSWFFRTPSIGAGGQFSNNGTLTTNAGAVCQ